MVRSPTIGTGQPDSLSTTVIEHGVSAFCSPFADKELVFDKTKQGIESTANNRNPTRILKPTMCIT